MCTVEQYVMDSLDQLKESRLLLTKCPDNKVQFGISIMQVSLFSSVHINKVSLYASSKLYIIVMCLRLLVNIWWEVNMIDSLAVELFH